MHEEGTKDSYLRRSSKRYFPPSFSWYRPPSLFPWFPQKNPPEPYFFPPWSFSCLFSYGVPSHPDAPRNPLLWIPSLCLPQQALFLSSLASLSRRHHQLARSHPTTAQSSPLSSLAAPRVAYLIGPSEKQPRKIIKISSSSGGSTPWYLKIQQ